MNGLTKILCAGLFLILSISTAWAANDNFVIRAIRVDGLQRISQATVIHYLPVHVGQSLTSTTSAAAIRDLYQTGFFDNVNIARENNTLVIRVTERPTIASINVSGNKDIDKDKLTGVLKDVGLVEGRVLDNAALARVVYGLREQYQSSGHYDATVTPKITPETRNRVNVSIVISEGPIAKIKQIDIVGNHAFTTKKLIKELPISTPNLLSFFTSDDQYSKDKLDKAEEALRSYYLDHGYLNFKIDSSDATLTPDKKEARIVFHVTEGALYTFKDYRFVGNLIVPEKQLRDIVDQRIQPHAPFSRKAVITADNAVGKALGDQGYVFANINAVPKIDEKTKQVSLIIYVDPGQRIFVRRINFIGNTKTADEVLRREMRQMEGGVASVTQIKESKRRLNLLGYLQHIKIKTTPVPDVPDQVDLEYHVSETPSAAATAGIGYGTDGFVFNAGVNQSNFMGSGKTVGVAFDNNPYSRTYSFNYNNPYYTVDGIQRGFTLFSQRTTPGRLNIANFTTDTYGGSITYTVPVSAKNDSIQLSLGVQKVNLGIGTTPSTQLLNFVNDNGNCMLCNTSFRQTLLSAGWNRNGLDKLIFPTRGLNQVANIQVSAPLGGRPLDYYKASYNAHWYHPLTKQFVFTSMGSLGYGGGYASTKGLPFFQNYYAGGMGYAGAVRGYASNSLGPKDSQSNPLGGNLLVAGSVGLVFPNFISPDRLRTTLFVDAGNVYNTRQIAEPPYQPNQHAGSLRYSTGIAVEWRVPSIGLLNFAVAKALNPQVGTPTRTGDDVRYFDFSFGTNF